MHWFIEIGLIDHLDDPHYLQGMRKVDPFSFKEELTKLPIVTIISAGDEFMQMDWSQIWNDENNMFKDYGEMHLMIVPNDEHSLMMNLPAVLNTGASFVRSLAKGETAEQRPQFTHSYDNETGEITVNVLGDVQPDKVALRYTQTYSKLRRDFRYFRVDIPEEEKCSFPEIHLPSPYVPIKPKFGGNCMSWKYWHKIEIQEDPDVPG